MGNDIKPGDYVRINEGKYSGKSGIVAEVKRPPFKKERTAGVYAGAAYWASYLSSKVPSDHYETMLNPVYAVQLEGGQKEDISTQLYKVPVFSRDGHLGSGLTGNL